MTWKTRFALTLVMSALFASSALAQDSTATAIATEAAPAATVESTEAAAASTAEAIPAETTDVAPAATVEARPTIEHIVTTPQAVPTATDEETETTVGALTLIHPKTWFAVQAPDGKTLLTNVDLFSLPADAEIPTEAVIAQLEVFSLSQLPEGMAPVEYATDILQSLPVEAGMPAPIITEIEVNGVVLGRGDFSQPGNENIIYIRLLDADTFLLAIVGSITEGEVAKNETVFQQSLGTLQVIYDAPFPEDVSARYEGIEQSTSPEGFPQLGNPDAPVKIIEIGSFDCPHCREFHDLAVPMLLERIQAGDVQFTYVPIFGTGSLPRGQQAALAALCAADQGKFWEYHDGLFGWQDFGTMAFLDARLYNGAEGLDLDTAAFNDCLKNDAALDDLQAAVDFVQAMPDFGGTPTVLLNGLQVDWSRLPTLIDEALLIATSTEEAVTVEATAETEAGATVEAPAATEETPATVEATAEATSKP